MNDQNHAVAKFEPSKGTIPPKSKVRVKFELTMYIGGPIDELFICDVTDVEMPLGFVVKAEAFGLNVAYLTGEEQIMSQSIMNGFSEEKFDKTVYGSMNKLEMVNFSHCRINKPTTFKFMLKNLSGIRT